VSCDVDKVRGITIFVRKKVGGIDPTHPPRVRRLWVKVRAFEDHPASKVLQHHWLNRTRKYDKNTDPFLIKFLLFWIK